MAGTKLLVCLVLASFMALALARPSRVLLMDAGDPTAKCEDAPADSIDVPANAESAFVVTVDYGTRNFTCGADGDVELSYAIANLTGDYSGVVYYNQDGVAVFDLDDATTGAHVGDIWLDTSPTLVDSDEPDTLALGRWKITKVEGDLPMVAYLTRTDTEGGATPSPCDPEGAEFFVPFGATYTFYSCS